MDPYHVEGGRREPGFTAYSHRDHMSRRFWRRTPRLTKVIYALILSGLMTICYLSLFSSRNEARFPLGTDEDTSFEAEPTYLEADVQKQEAVVAAFKHAWNSYEQDAMGDDEYHPMSHRGSNLSLSGGIGYTVVDAIDTMQIMSLKSEYTRAREWIRSTLTFERQGNFNTFETTIRVLGGLLSAYHLSQDSLFLERADDLGSRLLTAFSTSSGLPLPMADLGRRVGVPDQWSAWQVSTAEAATLQLEFRYLAELTGNQDYWYKAEKVMEVINKALPPHHLVPITMDANTGTFTQSEIRLGSRGDSYYEYLLKQYLQTNRTEPIYKEMYDDSMQGLHDKLVHKTPTKHMTYIAELLPSGGSYTLSHKQDHLVCFLAGSLMLGATTVGAISGKVSLPPRMEELTPKGQRDWNTGVELLETCVHTYESETGLSPEITMFYTERPTTGDRDWYIKGAQRGGPASYDARYMLRPETVESVFLAWRLTGDTRYRDYAWKIFSAIEKHCRLPKGGYATVLDVDSLPVRYLDKQETFFMSETLKYLYLTFSDSSVISLKDHVFNTEAHPIPIFKPTIKPAFPSSP
ncbi:mannosyl-oligosaccharide alpha-1,2-mannosidase [Pleurotus pulmonarius]|nr:mannosyl-oligosaccharide alpha-1,2-mannosidase [Pleurotus pulmonarius]